MKKTAIELHQERSERLLDQVKTLFGWSDQEYFDFKYDSGAQYLCWLIPGNKRLIESLRDSKLFWNWWKLCWDARDDVFFSNYNNDLDRISIEELECMYRESHRASWLVLAIRPANIVMETAYLQLNRVKDESVA